MYDNSVRSFANSVRCRASRSRIDVSNVSGMGDPQILAETIPLQSAKLNRAVENAGRRREGARGRGGQQRLPTPFFICSKGGLDRSQRARVERYKCSLQARSLSFKGWGLIDLPLRASNKGWFIRSISSIWLVGPEILPEEPDRPANQTDEPGRVAQAQKIISPHPPSVPRAQEPDQATLLFPNWRSP